jgi:hypothetical protein
VITGLHEREMKKLVDELLETVIEFSEGRMSKELFCLEMYIEEHQIAALRRWMPTLEP